jgi:hypothetical protein
MYFTFYKLEIRTLQAVEPTELGAKDRAGAQRRRAVKPPRKLFKIGEVMKYSGLSRQTIHNYTIWGLLSEAERTPSDHRLYGEEVFDRIRRIQELKKSNHTLNEIRQILAEGR